MKKVFLEIINSLPSATEGKLFGAPSIKASNGKNAAFLWQNNMTFKLDETDRLAALQLKGAAIGRHIYATDKEMKGWVTIPAEHADKWKIYATLAIEFVSS